MALYRVSFEGEGGSAAGFSVIAWELAESAETAEARARLSIYRAWSERIGTAALPELTCVHAHRVCLLRAFFEKPGVSSFVFHEAD